MALTNTLDSIAGVAGQVSNASALLNAFLVTLQKVNFDVKDQVTGGKSFLFAGRGDDSIELNSEITEHYSEMNEPLNDDIALKSPTVTVRGYIGELTDEQPGLLSVAKSISTQLTALAPFQPALTQQAQAAYNAAQQALDTAAAAATELEQAFDLATGQDFQNKQQKAFAYFEARRRALFTVQTPWKMFKDMVIVNLRPTQGEETAYFSEFQITFKQLRFASNELSDSKLSQGRRSAQGAPVVDHGPQNPPFVGPLRPTSLAGL